jgi:DHA2 family multidrug resistance protein
VLQGLCGAALTPMSQAVLFDIYPREQHGRAMGLWGLGVVLGPTLGPLIGGWLTDTYSWRWVFYINVPFGILAVLGALAYLPDAAQSRKSFDFFGFSMLSIAVGALQVFLDRGPIKDWFSSTEIRLEAAAAAVAFYLFVVHTLTTPRPFIRFSMYRDRNFLSGNVLIFVIGVVLFAVLALLPPLLQGLMGYSVFQSGVATAPRGVGTFIAMLVAGRIVGRIDSRVIIGTGLMLAALSLWRMSHFSMLMDISPVVCTGVIQGLGVGLAYVPMAALTFATLPALMRNEGTALFNLVRNIGSSVGISAVQGIWVHNTQLVHASLAQHVTALTLSTHAYGPYAGAQALAALNREVTAQASMIAYIDDFHFILILTVVSTLMLLMVRNPGGGGAGTTHVMVE